MDRCQALPDQRFLEDFYQKLMCALVQQVLPIVLQPTSDPKGPKSEQTFSKKALDVWFKEGNNPGTGNADAQV